MAIRPKVHSDSARKARQFARENLGIKSPKLRAPTDAEALQSTKKAHFDTNQVRDSVVIQDKKGQEFLLMMDMDPKLSRHNNLESAILTASSMIPVLGAPIVAMFAIKDIVQGKAGIAKAKAAGEASDPAHKASMRMGMKHLGLSGLSLATGGVGGLFVAGAEAAEAIAGAHSVVVGAEVAGASHDTVNAHKHEDDRKHPHLKSFFAAVKGLLGVHDHHERDIDDARVVVVQLSKADGSVDKSPQTPFQKGVPVSKTANAPAAPPG